MNLKKIISYKKLEELSDQELDIQKKFYKNEITYYKNFEEIFQFNKNNYLRFFSNLKKIKLDIIKDLEQLKKYLIVKDEYFLLKDFLLFNKVVSRFHFRIYYLKKNSYTNSIEKKILEIIKEFKSKNNLNLIGYFKDLNSEILDEIKFHKFKFEDIFSNKDINFNCKYYFDRERSELFYSIADINLNLLDYLDIKILGIQINKPYQDFINEDEFVTDMLYKFKDLTPCSALDYNSFSSVKNERMTFKDFFTFSVISDETDKDFVPYIYDEAEIARFKNYLLEYNIKNLRKIELIQRGRVTSREKLENIGYIYVLSNDAYPGIYKIGSTYGLPEERAEELTGTGHLESFKVVAKSKIQSAEYYEKLIHRFLENYRVKKNREFFKLDIKNIKNYLKELQILSDNGKKKVSLTDLKKNIRIG